jgi:hypothetical protein
VALQSARWVQVGALVLLAGAVLVAIGILIFQPFPPLSCDQKVIREFPSPNGWQKAVVMRINCHATTAFVTAVVLARAGQEIDLDKQMIFSMKGNDGVLVLWKDTALVIEHSKRDRIYRKAVVWDGQPITYIEREP